MQRSLNKAISVFIAAAVLVFSLNSAIPAAAAIINSENMASGRASQTAAGRIGPEFTGLKSNLPAGLPTAQLSLPPILEENLSAATPAAAVPQSGLEQPEVPPGKNPSAVSTESNGREIRTASAFQHHLSHELADPFGPAKEPEGANILTEPPSARNPSLEPAPGIPRTEGPAGEPPAPLSVKASLANSMVIFLPFMAVVGAIVSLWGHGIDAVQLGILGAMYAATGLGVTMGYHRLFTHRSFQTKAPIKILLAVLGSMAFEGKLFYWVGRHREHHQFSDREGDPHSPHLHGNTWKGIIQGLWHAHMGWLITEKMDGYDRYISDLKSDKLLSKTSDAFLLWAALGLAIPAVLGGWLTSSWTGVWQGFLWGGLVRVFLVHHVTWSINSICHFWGSRPYQSGDESRNNWLFGLLGFGEGFHNAHHAFPTSARHGLRWWEFDSTYCLIWCLERLGLASKVQIPRPEQLSKKSTVQKK